MVTDKFFFIPFKIKCFARSRRSRCVHACAYIYIYIYARRVSCV